MIEIRQGFKISFKGGLSLKFITKYNSYELWGWIQRVDFDGVGFTVGVSNNNSDDDYVFSESLQISDTAMIILYGTTDRNVVVEAIKSMTLKKAKARIDLGLFELGKKYVEVINSNSLNINYVAASETEIQYNILKLLRNIRQSCPNDYQSRGCQLLGFRALYNYHPETLLKVICDLKEAGAIENSKTVPVLDGGIYIKTRGIKLLKKLERQNQFKINVSYQEPSSATVKNKVFIIHGRNEALRKSMFEFLRSIGLQPIEWVDAIRATGKPSPYIGEILDAAFEHAQVIIALLTPDDEARLMPQYCCPCEPEFEKILAPQARPNVLFETGMAFGRSQERTVIVEIGHLRPFSDIAGRHVVRLNDSPEKRLELISRLKLAGCEVNSEGTDWLSAGKFEFMK